MSSTTLLDSADEEDQPQDIGGQMSFLEHLDELRKRIIRSVVFVFIAFLACWFVSDHIYNFLSRPVRKALVDAKQQEVPLIGLNGMATFSAIRDLHEEDTVRYVFREASRLGRGVIPAGTSLMGKVVRDGNGQLGLYTDERIIAGEVVLDKGVLLPVDLVAGVDRLPESQDTKLIVTSAMEPFSLYVKVSLYAAICLSVPFLLWQIWAFVSPGLYPHERTYATPFIGLSTISFVIGAAFAYYVIFPPAVTYLLGLGPDFQLLLKADDYFDFIILIMLAMGAVFQMPAITYVLARIGLVTAGFLVRIWKVSTVVILVASAVLSPTNDVLNMMLFAAPMVVLYFVSIFVAWIFGRERTVE
ncbi:MAG: twin-arginine translocase subunit TatC [Pyrinomonadaceae bacterium]